MRLVRTFPLVCGLWLGVPPGAASAEPRPATVSPAGRPQIVLDHLGFPDTSADTAYYQKKLREFLYRETRRAIWGAGRENTITYRFTVTELEIAERGDVVTVRCRATGQLPKGKTAKGALTYSGAASDRRAVVVHVLEIVARGVVARLSELERTRRGQPD